MTIGDAVVFVDEYKIEHAALLTHVFDNGDEEKYPTPAVNLVFVSGDSTKGDTYGRQIERQTSCAHISNNTARANCAPTLPETIEFRFYTGIITERELVNLLSGRETETPWDWDEEDERSFIDDMHGIDAVVANATRMYPDHTWTRSEIIQCFYMRLMTDKLHTIAHANDED